MPGLAGYVPAVASRVFTAAVLEQGPDAETASAEECSA